MKQVLIELCKLHLELASSYFRALAGVLFYKECDVTFVVESEDTSIKEVTSLYESWSITDNETRDI